MEEEFEELFNNETLSEHYNHYGSRIAHITIITIACMIGIAGDIILITAIAINKRMQNRTNLLLLCFLSLDIATLLLTVPIFVDIYSYIIDYKGPPCFIYKIDLTMEVYQLIAMAILTTDWFMLNKNFKDHILIRYLLTALVVSACVMYIVCFMDKYVNQMSYTIIALIILILVVALVCKDIFRCCTSKRNPMNDETKFRINIARIYLYTEIIEGCLINPFFYGVLGIFLYSFQFLVPVLMLIYVFRTNRNFKICILNLFRRKENRYNMDATIGFTEANEGEEDGNRVSIRVNATGDPNFTL